MDDNLQDFKESMNAWGWSVNARNNFNKFIDAIETEQGLIEQIQRIQSIIDDIVLNKEISQFKKCLEVGTDYRTKKLLENEQRSYNYQRERNGIHADRYCMDDHADVYQSAWRWSEVGYAYRPLSWFPRKMVSSRAQLSPPDLWFGG